MCALRIFPLRVFSAVIVAGISACSGESGVNPVDPSTSIASIDVSSIPTSLIVGETYTLSAIARNSSGAQSDVPVLWRSSNEAVATVAAGLVTATGTGAAEIFAESGGKSASTGIAVVTTERLVSEDHYSDGVIGFSSARNGGELDVYVIGPAGAQRVTTSPDHEQFDGWSPDGTRVALLRFPVNTDLVTSHIAKADGSEDLLVSNGIVNWAPDWLHRGTVLENQITLSNSDGSGQHTVGAPGFALFGPWWSPDGRRVAFGVSLSQTELADIYVANLDGTGLLNVTKTPLVSEEFASWSPDGLRLAITGENRNTGLGNSLFVVDASGAGLKQLTTSTANRADYEPQWSPDGKLISYTTFNGRTFGLFVIDPRGGEPVRLAPSTMVAGYGKWSPDGKRIAFTAIAEGNSRQNIFIITLDRRTMIQLTRNSGDNLGPFWRPN
jgi:Tol biopolymer transport system component